MQKKKLGIFLRLHILLMVYSMTGILSKLASKKAFMSFEFCCIYGLMIILLGIYAVGWQQIIKHIPLTTAFANKSVTTIWGLIWGTIVFSEPITIGKLIGVMLVFCGILLFSMTEEEQPK